MVVDINKEEQFKKTQLSLLRDSVSLKNLLSLKVTQDHSNLHRSVGRV